MNTRTLGLTALLITTALWCRPAAALPNVNTQGELSSLIQGWALSAETEIRLPSGDFVIDGLQLSDVAGNIPRAPLIIKGDGNSNGTAPATRLTINGAAQFKNGTLGFENLVLMQANVRATDVQPGLRSINLHRVRVEGANIQVANGGGLNITSSLIVGGTFTTQGPNNATIERNTFLGGGLNLSPTTLGTVNANIFDGVVPIIRTDGGMGGQCNFVRGNSDIGDPGNPLFALKEGETKPREPLYTAATTDWPGKLSWSLLPKTGAPATLTVQEDFEGVGIGSGSAEIGADEVGLAFPIPTWSRCSVRGPAGATVYDVQPGDLVPIVRGGVTLDIQIALAIPGAADIFRPKFDVVVQPQGISSTTDTDLVEIFPVAEADFIRSTDNNEISFDFQYTTPSDAENFDGRARILLRVDDSDITPSGSTGPVNEFIIDSLPPLIPIGIGPTSTNGTGSCNGWARVVDAQNPTGVPDSNVPPHFFFNANPTLSTTFTVNVEDQSSTLSRGGVSVSPETAGFAGAPLPIAGDVANTQVDALTGKSQWGTVSWAADTLTSQGGTAVVTHPGTGTTSTDVSWAINFPAQTGATAEVRNWAADLIVTDLAGNSTTVPLSTYFWWLPPGSTSAAVTADSKDPASPSFSWELLLNGSSASAQQLPAECPPVAQFLICFADDPATAETTSGWTALTPWSLSTSAAAVGPNTTFDIGSTNTSLVEILRNQLGQAIIVIPRSDFAGNTQPIPDLDVGSSTTLTLTELAAAGVSFAGPYFVPSRPPEGSLDTIVTTTLFLNRLDSTACTLWSADSDETSYGAGPNVPLTPLRLCNQRVEGQFLIDIAVPDNLPAATSLGDLSVEYVVLEGGKLVALGNLNQLSQQTGGCDCTYSGNRMSLTIPMDLISVENGGSSHCNTAILAQDIYNDQVRKDPDDIFDRIGDGEVKFLNFAPQNCNRSVRDRLGDDGQVPRTGELDADGRLLARFRTRPIEYTIIFTATNDPASAATYPARDQTAIYDPTPTVVRFTVLPDQSNDSDAPPIKANSKP